MALTEIWLGSGLDESVLQEIIPEGYDYIHFNQTNRHCGGIALMFKKGIEVEHITNNETKQTYGSYTCILRYEKKGCVKRSIVYQPLLLNPMLQESAHFLIHTSLI